MMMINDDANDDEFIIVDKNECMKRMLCCRCALQVHGMFVRIIFPSMQLDGCD